MEYIDNLPPMDLMRSEKMVFFQLIMPFESAQRAISYLGELGLLQFCDIESCPLQKRALQTLDDNNNGFQSSSLICSMWILKHQWLTKNHRMPLGI